VRTKAFAIIVKTKIVY